MTINEYLQDKTLTAVEIADGIMFNVVCDELVTGLDVDTSNVTAGTQLQRRYDFTQTANEIFVDTLSVNKNTTNVLE